jgi:hypothetical protein
MPQNTSRAILCYHRKPKSLLDSMQIGIDLHISQNISSDHSDMMQISQGRCRTQNSI